MYRENVYFINVSLTWSNQSLTFQKRYYVNVTLTYVKFIWNLFKLLQESAPQKLKFIIAETFKFIQSFNRNAPDSRFNLNLDTF